MVLPTAVPYVSCSQLYPYICIATYVLYSMQARYQWKYKEFRDSDSLILNVRCGVPVHALINVNFKIDFQQDTHGKYVRVE